MACINCDSLELVKVLLEHGISEKRGIISV